MQSDQEIILSDSLSSQRSEESVIQPHVYPLWIKIISGTCLLFFLVCMTKMPYYFTINREVKYAHALLRNKDFSGAYNQYVELAFLFPKSEKIKIWMAYSLFQTSSEENHVLAVRHLASINLSSGNWKELLKYMPEKYIAWFEKVELEEKA